MRMDHRYPNEDKNHPSHSLRGHGSKIRTENSLKWLFLLVFKFCEGRCWMDFDLRVTIDMYGSWTSK
jgi:hypothetical protein